MSSKNEILNSIKGQIKIKYDMPALNFNGITYSNKLEQFINILTIVGGKAITLKKDEDINQCIKLLYPEAKIIASNLPYISIATLNPDESQLDAFNNLDLSIIEGQLGVAENGSVWIPQNVKEKAAYFAPESLVIIISKDSIVNNMHEAYNQISFCDKAFGVFISGPSKTADIEQALVMGAHGAKSIVVIIRA